MFYVLNPDNTITTTPALAKSPFAFSDIQSFLSLESVSKSQMQEIYQILTGEDVIFNNRPKAAKRIFQILEATDTQSAAPTPSVKAAKVERGGPKVTVQPQTEQDRAERKSRRVTVEVPTSTPKPRKPKVDKVAGEPKVKVGDKVMELLRRPEGASATEIMESTGWLAHTMRAAMSKGGLQKKFDVVITSKKVDGGERVYRVAA